MKKIALILALLVMALSAHTAYAACKATSINQVTAIAGSFTATDGTFTNRAFLLPSNTATRNQFLAILLTALSSGKNIIICTNSYNSGSVLTALQLRP